MVLIYYFDILMIVEELFVYLQVMGLVVNGGLGFNYKWNMGWMYDILDFFMMDLLYWYDYFNLLIFVFVYMFDEWFILLFLYDEVVYGKKLLMYKMLGDCYNQFVNLWMMLIYMVVFLGK